jgi:tetratricopeptide (TPR) repeat protein
VLRIESLAGLETPMPEDGGAWAAGLLVDEAWAAHREGHYRHAAAAAGRAVEAGEQLDDPVLLVRALSAEASALRQMGDHTAALARYTRILGLAEDPATAGRLDHPSAARAVAEAHWGWVVSARFLTGIPLRELFGVLDAADRWLAATGHKDWRAAILSERASVYQSLGEMDAAIAAAEEALALKIQHPDAPGYTLGTYRYLLGDILREAGRAAEAAPHYHAILDTPAASPWERRAAHKGLAWCALDADDAVTGRREARTALSLAESLGDNALCTSLEVLAAACRADGDLDAAWQAATRRLEAAGRIGGHHRPYYAAREAVDIALDRADLAAAKRLLGELDEHAAALDATTGTTTRTSQNARRHQRLAELETASP